MEVCILAQQYIPRMVNFEPKDYTAVKDCSREFGLGSKGFSAAVRLIIREWVFLRKVYIRSLENSASGIPGQISTEPVLDRQEVGEVEES